MTLPARFTTLDSGLDAFLFATVGQEENGMPLSVASVMARLGLDPWTEAGRLAALPQGAAIESLTSLIGRVPLAPAAAADPIGIATRLVQLLRSGASRPSPASPPAPAATPARARLQAAGWSRLTKLILLLLCLGLMALAAVSTLGGGASLLNSVSAPVLQQKVTP